MPWSLAIPAIMGLAQLLGGAGSSKAQGDTTEAQLALGQGGLQQDRFSNLLRALELELQQRQYQLTAPDVRAKQSVRGDLMANMQDVGLTGVSPNIPVIGFTGGLRPSLLSPSSRAFGRDLTRQALLNQLAVPRGAPMSATSMGTGGSGMSARAPVGSSSIERGALEGQEGRADKRDYAHDTAFTGVDTSRLSSSPDPFAYGSVSRGDQFGQIPLPPQVQNLPSGRGNGVLGGAALGLGALGLLAPLFGGGRPQTTPPYFPPNAGFSM